MGKLAGTLVVSSKSQHWVSEHQKRGHFFLHYTKGRRKRGGSILFRCLFISCYKSFELEKKNEPSCLAT